MLEVTEDTLLGGRVRLRQPRAGYRAATDAVFLAAACGAAPGESVFDLGCGVGAAALCCAARAGARVTGLEIQPHCTALARENAVINGLSLDVIEGDAAAPPQVLRAMTFDRVITNPPYFDRAAGVRARDAGRDRAFGESIRLAAWLDAGLRRLAPGGEITLIHRAERLTEILSALDNRCGAIRILPIVPREGREAGRVVVAARKASRAPLKLLSPFVIHRGARHERDGEDLTQAAHGVLRDGAALPLADR